MKRISLFAVRAFALVSFLFLQACAEDPLGSSEAGEGYTITLHLAATVSPIYDTKILVQPSVSGSETGEGRFDCEMVSSDADSVGFSLVTKAPTTLKNVYALLFTSSGAFNGRAAIGTITAGSALDITFTNVTTTNAANSRLVIIANDNAAATNYASSGGTGGFGSFSGTYADFQKLTLTSNIAIDADADVPYAGYATFNLLDGDNDTDISVPIYRTLAKIAFNNRFSITGGPGRNSITLYNGGGRHFATQGNNNYDGSGSTYTTAFATTPSGSNDDTNVWYVGENIRPEGSGVLSGSDRNKNKAPANACYIRIESDTLSIGNTPSIGQEYIGASSSFAYDIYLGKSSDVSDFSVRRNMNYTLTTSVSGTLAEQQELSLSDSRVMFTKGKDETAGLCIGCFGGASGYTNETGDFTAVSGSYTRLLLLQPNTSGTTAADNVRKVWSNATTQLQPEARKFWDPTYTLSKIDKTPGHAYDYCYNLTLGGVAKGTWYLPTEMQLAIIYAAINGLKGNSAFVGYSAFSDGKYWTSSERNGNLACLVNFNISYVSYESKSNLSPVRCMRDVGNTLSAQEVTTVGGYPVVDLSSFKPLGCLLTSLETSARCASMNAQIPNNSTYMSVGSSFSGIDGTWNAKMSGKFQVMCADHTEGTADWAMAYTRCKEYSGEGGVAGQWRLPTQRELILIAALHPQLRGVGGFSPFISSSYWSSTEYGTSAHLSSFGDGTALSTNKSSLNSVRCVRDL